MRFTERKEFLYDPAVFKRRDSDLALRLHSEYVRKMSPQPPPVFLEVDRHTEIIDSLWHVPMDDRTKFSRQISMPVIVQLQRPDWRLTRLGLVPLQKAKIWCGNLILQELDYFPIRGDFVVYNGYRHMIINTVVEPAAYWHMTNIWLGLLLETCIPPEGDARPLLKVTDPAPAEIAQTRPAPEA